MIVTFTTTIGTKYHLDHTNKVFVQESSGREVRSGPLLNNPAVRGGHPVEIQTTDPTGRRPLRVIVTARVSSKEVSFA